MDPVILSRWQFAITTIYHFFFVPVTLGLALFLAILETKYVTSGDETYKKMVKFWGKIFLINFILGMGDKALDFADHIPAGIQDYRVIRPSFGSRDIKPLLLQGIIPVMRIDDTRKHNPKA